MARNLGCPLGRIQFLLSVCHLLHGSSASIQRDVAGLSIAGVQWHWSTPMFNRCPKCNSFDVRRSSVREAGASPKPTLRSPYRCRNCGERFWVISRRAYYLAGLIGVAVVAGVAAWFLVGAPDEPRRGSKPAASVTDSLPDAIKLAASNDPAAEYRLAHMYANASGVDGNKKEALTWLNRAA